MLFLAYAYLALLVIAIGVFLYALFNFVMAMRNMEKVNSVKLFLMGPLFLGVNSCFTPQGLKFRDRFVYSLLLTILMLGSLFILGETLEK